jgi:hypothetical protein
MNAISRSFSAMGLLALAASFVAAAPSLANASHNLYPSGWEKSQPTGPVLYQFVPGGERYHVVTSATTESGTTK